MQKTGAAIIGCGAIHSIHTQALRAISEARLVCVADTVAEKAQKTAAENDCEGVTDYAAVLVDPRVEVVHICLPHYLHVPIAEEALLAGKHVFCEKPMAMTPEGVRRVQSAAVMSGKRFAVCFQNRMNPSSLTLRSILESGRAGRILGIKAVLAWHRGEEYYIQSEWRGRWKTEGGGVLINQAIHTLDLVQWLGGPVKSVQANISTRSLSGVIEVEDTADVRLEFENGAVGLLYATNAYTENAPVELEVFCENMRFQIRNGLTVWDGNQSPRFYPDEVDAQSNTFYYGTSHTQIIRSFYQSLRRGEAPQVDEKQGAESVFLLDRIYRAAGKERMLEC